MHIHTKSRFIFHLLLCAYLLSSPFKLFTMKSYLAFGLMYTIKAKSKIEKYAYKIAERKMSR